MAMTELPLVHRSSSFRRTSAHHRPGRNSGHDPWHQSDWRDQRDLQRDAGHVQRCFVIRDHHYRSHRCNHRHSAGHCGKQQPDQQRRLPSPRPLQLVPVAPCRLVDTRQNGGPIQGGTSRNFTIASLGGCGIPSNAGAYSLNVTAVPHGRLGPPDHLARG